MYKVDDWDYIYTNEVLADYPNCRIVSFIFRSYGKGKGDHKRIKLLDLGCGSGNNLWFFSREGFDTYGIDGSSKALLLAEKRLEKEQLRATLIQGFFNKLPFPDDCFDVIVDEYSMQANLIEDIVKISTEVQRILRPGGIFFGLCLTDKNRNMMCGEEIEENSFLSTTGAVNARKRTIHFFRKGEIKRILSSSGFNQVEIGTETVVSPGENNNLSNSWIYQARK